MSDPNSSSPTPITKAERMPLEALYPACFDWKQPQPLKLGIHHDLIAAGYDRQLVRRALGAYCRRPSYLKALRVGAIRLDLHGQPAGVVTEADVELARATQAWATYPPNDTPLPKESLVPGRLELKVKFSELPQPLRVQDGFKIGIQTEAGIVTAILPPALWRKLEQTTRQYPRWLAILSGASKRLTGEDITLKYPTVQVFEKPARPETPPTADPATASTSAKPTPDPQTSKAETPAVPDSVPTLGSLYPNLSLKGHGTPAVD